MREKNGQFVKGKRYSVATEFKKGEHWRKPQPFREKQWLEDHYITQKISAGEIADMFGVTSHAIVFWLKKHNIPRRNVSEARKIKHWGAVGSDNPMWNKKGELNPNWKGGVSAERQTFYSSQAWKKACAAVWRRDNATCQRCNMHKSDSPDMPFHIHHVVSFADKELRVELSNLKLLCEACHRFVHSKKNTKNEFLQKK